MSHQDYVRFLTEQLVTKMNETKIEKRQRKKERHHDIFSHRWFGLFPFTWKILTKK